MRTLFNAKFKSGFNANFKSRFIATPLVLVSLLTACGTNTPKLDLNAKGPNVTPTTVEDALKLKDDGRLVDAANSFVDVYKQSAASDRVRYLFEAAQLYLSVQNDERATEMLNSLKESTPTSPYATLLAAQLSLRNNNILVARSQLSNTRLSALNAAGKGVYWVTMAEAHRQSGLGTPQGKNGKTKLTGTDLPSDALSTLHAFVKAEEFLTSTNDLSANQESIWQLLAAQPISVLREFRYEATETASKAWIDLAMIAKDTELSTRAKRIAAWRKQYPDQVVLDQRLLELSNTDWEAKRHLALILPTRSKELGAAARAVWEGFKSIQAKSPGAYPVKLYETDEKVTTTLSVYNTAVDKGAILIVGPLPRAALIALAKRRLLSVPTVALNVIDTETVPVNLYQFGLPITHEAKLIARAAKDKGFTEAIVIKGRSPLDARSADAFTREWTRLKRPVKYQVAVNDVNGVVRATANGNPASTMVFVAADFRNALTSIKSLPTAWSVFGTSSLNTMSGDAAKLAQARHIYFVDSPSLIKAAATTDQIPASIGRDIISSRLFWLGVDVCRLTGLLLNEEIRFNRPVMDGATGRLLVTRNRTVERELQVVSLHEAHVARYNTNDFARLADLQLKPY